MTFYFKVRCPGASIFRKITGKIFCFLFKFIDRDQAGEYPPATIFRELITE